MTVPLTDVNRLQQVMAYAAQLELEVDRLRRRDQFLQLSAKDHIKKTMQLCSDVNPADDPEETLAAVVQTCNQFGKLLADLHEPPGYHPAFDQVITVAVRPLVEQVFRWQQRLSGLSNAVLRLDLESEYIDWFPSRLRHILDNLVSNALRYCDLSKGEIRVGLNLRVRSDNYELQFTDNGIGVPDNQAVGMLELFYRAAPTRAVGLGVGLAVVKFMVEQCCGTVSVSSGKGHGTSITVLLPRYGVDDYVE